MGDDNTIFLDSLNYLRIYVTDRCNLSCPHCKSSAKTGQPVGEDYLSDDEIVLTARTAAEMGMDKIRLVGGEPLVRPGITDLVSRLAAIEGVNDISLTTNGILLEQYASELAEAGLHRVNINLDTLKYDRYREFTGNGELKDVFKGIAAALKANLRPVKINVVPMIDRNDDEINDFASMTIQPGWHIRYIFPQPLDRPFQIVPQETLFNIVHQLGALEPHHGRPGYSVASYYHFPGAMGTIGFFNPGAEPDCQKCNRLRLSANGLLFPCLYMQTALDLKAHLRKGGGTEELRQIFREAVAAKPRRT